MDVFDSIAKVFSDFGEWIVDWLLYILSYAAGILYAFGKFLFNALTYLFEIILYPLISILESILGALNFSSAINSLNGLMSNTGFGYFFQIFMVDSAIYAYLTAYLLRFVIRRLPFIG